MLRDFRRKGTFIFAFPVFARLGPNERGGASNLSWETLSYQNTAVKGSSGETNGLSAAGEP